MFTCTDNTQTFIKIIHESILPIEHAHLMNAFTKDERTEIKHIVYFSLQLSGPYYKAVGSREWTETGKAFKNGLAKFEEELERRNSPFFGGNVSVGTSELIRG